MPIKFKPSSRTMLKGTNKYKTEHFLYEVYANCWITISIRG